MGTNKINGEYGIRISDEVIAVSRNFLGKELLAKGIKVSQTDEGVEVDVYITVKYHAKIPAVAWDIQENVKKEIQSMTELDVTAVNIHVQGVKIPSEDKKQNDEK